MELKDKTERLAEDQNSKPLSDKEMDSVAGGIGSVYVAKWIVARHCYIFSAPQYKTEYWAGSIDAGSSLFKASPVNEEWMEFTVRSGCGTHPAPQKQLPPIAYIQTKNVAKNKR